MTRWFCVKLRLPGGARQTEIPPAFLPGAGSPHG